MSQETDLILMPLEGGGSILSPLAARNCQQTLQPILNGKMRRTINGRLVHTGAQSHQKYASVITCHDVQAPAFDGVWQGRQCTVGCIQRLSQSFEGEGNVTILRNAVEGSVVVFDEDGNPMLPKNIDGMLVTLPDGIKKGYVSYCPNLIMHVTDMHLDTDEWGMTVGWKLMLEEA